MEDKINKIWYQMNMKEITSEQARQQVLDLFAVSGRSELLVSFLQWYVKDEAQRENKELITSIVERYLNETNYH